MRIAKYIAACGYCSRRDAEKLIAAGDVSLNKKLISSPANFVNTGDVVTVRGENLKLQNVTHLWLYHKPVGYITTARDTHNRPTIFEQIRASEKNSELPRLISVGRLDLNSEGLLLLTNSGEMSRFLELPQNAFSRTYKVRAFGSPEKIINSGLHFNISGIKYNFKSIKLISQDNTKANCWYEVKLEEGKNREIRRVFEHLGLQVNRLIRTKYYNFSLGKLQPGEIKKVDQKSVQDIVSKFNSD